MTTTTFTSWSDPYDSLLDRLDDGKRIDILTERYAIEVDFAGKFYEAVGQLGPDRQTTRHRFNR